jgi:hypothetical protein
MFMPRKALNASCLLCLLLSAGASTPFAQSTEYAYVTGSGVTGNAVSGFTVDALTGALTPISGAPVRGGGSPGGFPTCFVTDPSGSFAYSLMTSGIPAYTIDGATGTLSLILGAPFGAGRCF